VPLLPQRILREVTRDCIRYFTVRGHSLTAYGTASKNSNCIYDKYLRIYCNHIGCLHALWILLIMCKENEVHRRHRLSCSYFIYYITSNARMINEWWIWKGCEGKLCWPNFKVLSLHLPVGTK
jgi:hypothetical protein